MTARPLIVSNAFLRPRGSYTEDGVTVCDKTRVFACVEEMVRSIDEDVKGLAVLLPTLADEDAVSRMLEIADGILLPGGYSNMHPSLYGQEPPPEGDLYAPEHDHTDLALLRAARRMDMPVLGICRGMQAINVSRGGALQHRIAPGEQDHMCSDPGNGMSEDPGQMHDIILQPGGQMRGWFEAERVPVNSLHVQALGRLGEGVIVEALAPDGIIEAISCPDQTFCIGVQWHPEALRRHYVSQTIFTAFGDACRAYARKKAA